LARTSSGGTGEQARARASACSNPQVPTANPAREAQAQVVRIEQGKLHQLDAAIRALQNTAIAHGVRATSSEYAGLSPIEAVRVFIRDEGNTGWTTNELADALLKRGVHTTSTNFVTSLYATLYTAMNKYEHFTRKNAKWYITKNGLEAA